MLDNSSAQRAVGLCKSILRLLDNSEALSQDVLLMSEVMRESHLQLVQDRIGDYANSIHRKTKELNDTIASLQEQVELLEETLESETVS